MATQVNKKSARETELNRRRQQFQVKDSDVDVHVIINYAQLQMPEKTAIKTVKTAGAQWNLEHEVRLLRWSRNECETVLLTPCVV